MAQWYKRVDYHRDGCGFIWFLMIFSLWYKGKRFKNSAVSGERSVWTLYSLCLPRYMRDTTWTTKYHIKSYKFLTLFHHKSYIDPRADLTLTSLSWDSSYNSTRVANYDVV